VVTVTRIDRLARSTFDLFAIVKRIVDAGAQFRSLAESSTCSPTLSEHGAFIREWGRIGRPSQLRHVPYPEDEAREALARRRRAK
jgi:hypothetical protein